MAAIDFAQYHTELRERLGDGRGAAAAGDLGPGRRLALRLADGAAVTYRSTGQTIEIDEGIVDPDCVVEMDDAAFADLVTESWSIFGLAYSGRLEIVDGGFDGLTRWEPALQALHHRRAIYGPAVASTLVDPTGEPLDLARSFHVDDDPAIVAHFLQTAGFVVVRAVFDSDEVAALAAAVEAARAAATPDDNRSWWATDDAGREVCCRVTYLAEHAPLLHDLPDDPRLLAIAALSGRDLVSTRDRLDGVSVVIKHPGVVEGLSDLPWHRDCGMGGHPVLCPGLNVGIQLDEASAANGQLRFLAGSHHHTNHPLTPEQEASYPVVAVEARPGDVTAHFGHVLHVAPPPTAPDAHRRALYCGFHQPSLLDVVAPGQGYNDVLFTEGDGRVRSPDERF